MVDKDAPTGVPWWTTRVEPDPAGGMEPRGALWLRHYLPPDFKQELGMRVTVVKQRTIESEAPSRRLMHPGREPIGRIPGRASCLTRQSPAPRGRGRT